MKTRIMAVAIAAGVAVLTGAGSAAAASGQPAGPAAQPTTPIKHFIFVMQGGRTFDNYFGTYPGADGIPAATCQLREPGRPRQGCVRPYSLAGRQPPPLGASKSVIAQQYNRGKMNGFVAAFDRQGRDGELVMGHYDRRDLPFYWNAAQRYVLFDHFFSSTLYGIRSNRSYWVSAAPAPGGTGGIPAGGYGGQPTIFDRLQAAGVSWKFYVEGYRPGQTYQTASPTNLETQTARVPLVDYFRFTHDPALLQHIVPLDQYYKDLTDGTLPAVSYVASSSRDNERSAASIPGGQRLVSNMVTQLMEGRYWDSSALLLSYDGSSGWFDHVQPPRTGRGTFGFRVPALLISAYARQGQVNHTVLDYTSALRFIEQNWHLPPLTSRDAHANSLTGAFNFTIGPRPPALIPSGPTVVPNSLPGVPSPSPPPVAATYLLYGIAAAGSVLLLLFAAWSPRIRAQRRAMAARRAATRDEAGT
jgi:phospholipase C